MCNCINDQCVISSDSFARKILNFYNDDKNYVIYIDTDYSVILIRDRQENAREIYKIIWYKI